MFCGSTLIIYCEPLSFLFCMQIKVASFYIVNSTIDWFLTLNSCLDLQGTEPKEKKMRFPFSTAVQQFYFKGYRHLVETILALFLKYMKWWE